MPLIVIRGGRAASAYALKLDISRYFPSIDHAILKALIRRHLKDRQLLGLLDSIIDTAPVPDTPGHAFCR